MLLRLFLAFTLIPALELYLLIRLGEWLGAAATVGLILVTGAVGAALARREGFAVLHALQTEARQGFPAGDRIVEGVLVLVGGLLLVTPGLLTDLTGFALIFPGTRRRLAPAIKRALLARVTVMGVDADVGPPRPASPQPPGPRARSPFDHPTS